MRVDESVVLDVFRAHRLTLKLKKWSFFSESIRYLDQEISKQKIPERRKIEIVMQMATLQSVKQVRQFLKLVDYFRRFIANFAIIVKPITRLKD